MKNLASTKETETENSIEEDQNKSSELSEALQTIERARYAINEQKKINEKNHEFYQEALAKEREEGRQIFYLQVEIVILVGILVALASFALYLNLLKGTTDFDCEALNSFHFRLVSWIPF